MCALLNTANIIYQLGKTCVHSSEMRFFQAKIEIKISQH